MRKPGYILRPARYEVREDDSSVDAADDFLYTLEGTQIA